MKKLMSLLQREEIHLSYKDLTGGPHTVYGLYFFEPERKICHIVLDSVVLDDIGLHRSVLSVALGHHFLHHDNEIDSAMGIVHSVSEILTGSQMAAVIWACDYLIPRRELMKAMFRGQYSIEQMAHHFRVSPGLMEKRVELFFMRNTEHHGWYYERTFKHQTGR